MPIAYRNVSFVYSAGSPFESAALRGIDCAIEPGSFLALVGRTGSGKSTMVQLLNALLVPTEGEVVVDEYVNSPDKKRRTKKLKGLRKKVGYVFQFPEYQLFLDTVEKELCREELRDIFLRIYANPVVSKEMLREHNTLPGWRQ